jgi:hypothetical protein
MVQASRGARCRFSAAIGNSSIQIPLDDKNDNIDRGLSAKEMRRFAGLLGGKVVRATIGSRPCFLTSSAFPRVIETIVKEMRAQPPPLPPETAVVLSSKERQSSHSRYSTRLPRHV